MHVWHFKACKEEIVDMCHSDSTLIATMLLSQEHVDQSEWFK